MTSQLLFLTSSTPRTRKIQEEERQRPVPSSPSPKISTMDDSKRLYQLLKYILLPGLIDNIDDGLDPILPWLQTKVGLNRLLGLLKLCVSYMESGHGSRKEDFTDCVNLFMGWVLGVDNNMTKKKSDQNRALLVNQCRKFLLLPQRHRPTNDTLHKPPKNLDLIQFTRKLLLFRTGGEKDATHQQYSVPIPSSAESRREGCISNQDRMRASYAFDLLTRAIMVVSLPLTVGDAKHEMVREALCSRFVAEILTVPILTWKISGSTLFSTLLLNDSSSMALTDLITAFSNRHSVAIFNSKKDISLILDSYFNEEDEDNVLLTKCPAPMIMCLLANLVQIGSNCKELDGSNVEAMNFEAATKLFNFLSLLIDTVPLGTFLSKRSSAVQWIHQNSTSTPIILSSVVLDQCRTFLLDSYVRTMFLTAIDDEILDTESILNKKDDKDLKQEKEMLEVGTASAASLAAKEAMTERGKSFWQSSKWARKLSKSVQSMFTGDDSKPPPPKAVKSGMGKLVDTSSIARKLAHGKGKHDRNVTAAVLATQDSTNNNKNPNNAPSQEETPPKRRNNYSPDLLFALCRAYGVVLARWGGGGKDFVIHRSGQQDGKDDGKDGGGETTVAADPCVLALLNVLCFSTSIVRCSWGIIQSEKRVISDLYMIVDFEKQPDPIRSLRIRPSSSIATSNSDNNHGAPVLFMFASCLAHVLIITDDVEIHEMDRPLPRHQLRRCILFFKKLLHRACCLDDTTSDKKKSKHHYPSNYFGLSLISSASKTMKDLYDRSSRRPLCIPKLWLIPTLLETELRRSKTQSDYNNLLLHTPVLTYCPFLIPFQRRLKLFERIVTTHRVAVQGTNEQQNLQPGVLVKIQRGRVLEDGLIHLNNLGGDLRRRISVQYVSEAGVKETGVDVGGLFKEFWTDLSRLAFDPNYALFRVTEGAGNCLYPNPSSRAAHGSDAIVLFEFLGRILGKALFEGITIQPQFAHFFLSFLKGDYNFLHMLPDLSTMDPQLYNNLMFLKTYDGDATDLCLSFTVANDDFGGNREVPLIPNGADIEVTNSNKQRYIGLVAKHHVCDRVREQSEAFTRGLWEVIDRSWLRIFNEPELQVLISGATDGKIDVADLKANTRYTGGYTGISKPVYQFWNVFSGLNSKRQADLLRFVTSCERPPPLGFASMNPPFTIQRVGILRDGDKLPSSSTCFNTLKLPTYSCERVLRERLVYAIEAGAGFELT